MMSLKEFFRPVVRLTCTGCAVALVLAALAGSANAGHGGIPVPEIDPGSLASAMVLVAGGVLVLRGRIRR
jgi:hypothetical protein